ncbi:MAG TPA: efflux RND transporter periplasmic adaptor subunit [Candidatus Acidoferrum sp.]|nr:efflux RND transporter periplasmic adaptor subunit [Candidatus Acidoferrum sp.]
MELQTKHLLMACLSAALLVIGCSEDRTETAAADAPVHTEARVASPALPKPRRFFTVSGPLIVEHQVDVTAQRDGIIVNISADAGTRVHAGMLLAQLDDRQLAANLEAAQAKTRSIAADLKNWEAEAKVLEADYGRAQRLWKEKLISEEQLQHAQYKAESDKWDILRVQELLNNSKDEEQSLELELEKTRVVAPFDGLVARRYVRAGQSVAKGDRMFWVTAEAPLRIRFTLPERFVGQVKYGQEFTLSSPDVPAEKHTVRVIEVSPVVDPASGTIEVLAEITGAHGGLRPGMNASVSIDDFQ